MQNASFAGRFKVGTRIQVGFLLILVLLALVAGLGIRSMSTVEAGFSRYAAISDNSLQIADLDSAVADMRRNVVTYSFSGSNALIETVQGQQKKVMDALRVVRDATQDPGRRANLDRMIQQFDAYIANFAKLVTARERRDRTVAEEVSPLGVKAREGMSAVMEGAIAAGDFEGAARAGQAMEGLMMARLSAQRFLNEQTPKAAEEVRDRMDGFIRTAASLAGQMTDPVRKRQVEEASQVAARYLDGFTRVVAAINEAQTLAFGTMTKEAEEFAGLVDKTIASQAETRGMVLTTARNDIEGTTTLLIGMAVGAFVLGILVALITARSIVRPVVGMTSTMTELAAGNLTVAVPALENRDEIGRMAKAVLVFKESAIEKRRMDEAERERLEAERSAAEAQRAREQAIGEEIAGLIDAVSKGDLNRRIDLAGKDGFYKTMSEGINRLTNTVEAVIADLGEVLSALAQGDLNRRVTRDYQGAFEKVKTDVNATSSRLADIVGQITQAAETIANAAAEVSLGSSDLADRTEQQASSLEETAASMEELGATVRSNADNAQRANVMATQARSSAESGGGVAGSAIEAMRRIEESSRKITDIIGVIDEIAFQTNLLALNAAVEAARAGDAGRGFAVVAQEVRQLAQRSAQASKEIKGLILDSDAQVKDGVDLVSKAGDALNGIVSGVQQVATLIAEMASASAEQATALDEINATVANMDEMTQKNAALVEETTAAAHAMSGQAGDLKGLIGFFRLDQTAGYAAPLRAAAVSGMPSAVSSAAVQTAAVQTAGRRAPVAAHGATKAASRPAARGNGAAAKPAVRAPAQAAPAAAPAAVLKHSVSDDDDWKEF
ncbi:methyl-accepting chemotaxis protein [Azospirillum picis]|uniref:Methyl-accepting chemotaxis protein n=1 Tax=Azospirillum picis TaxID=488438 RepID=A0ABU0MPX7_9PROT|nr:methyl-accepting chemotaxis protein [Azospirillum picis]MBP2301647.1 methyl-accepting chemotaxis protein [Azospirillum picis]MDQ0535530.1 methyl-accepting chemotaxis protein [Azospirillum picis]